ncbi:TlyA family RNA methyltransferase [Leptospira sp. 'Mane']|uniref:TlyA family RNA methyltransferase n=1 Tax=Leptospira sp. 'Mane' TaxID=3387407 RepID=UPI00398B726F
MPKEKIRLDDRLISLGLCKDKKEALSFILSGSVLVNDEPVTKIGTSVRITDHIRIREIIKQYVSRGAKKLLGALESFPNANPINKICWDWGASTGGFTQVLLERGAKHVYSVDVGYGQLAQKLANHKSVTVLDRTHIKELTWEILGGKSDSIFITMDLSFISLLSIFPTITRLAKESVNTNWEGISLLKPQFEVKEKDLTEGIVTNPLVIGRIIRQVWREIRKQDQSIRILGIAESPIKGTEGNREFLFWWKKEGKNLK